MPFLDPLLLAFAAILTSVSGTFLIRKSFTWEGPADLAGRRKSRALGGLVFLTSLLAIGSSCSLLWRDLGISLSLALLALYSLVAINGHWLIRTQCAGKWTTNVMVAAWIVWYVARDNSVSGSEFFLLGGLVVWFFTSLFLDWKKPSSRPALPEQPVRREEADL